MYVKEDKHTEIHTLKTMLQLYELIHICMPSLENTTDQVEECCNTLTN